MSYAFKKITRDFLATNYEDVKRIGLECMMCGKKLKVGDFADGHYPMYNQLNRCKECYLKVGENNGSCKVD